MELQFHPATGRRTVFAVSLGRFGERAAIAALAAVTVFVMSLWVTAPAVLRRESRRERSDAALRDLDALRRAEGEGRASASALAARALRWQDELNRVAFLYGVDPARWPRALDPGRGLLAADGVLALEGAPVAVRALERGRRVLESLEAADPELASRIPSLAPIADAPFEPAALFGPRVSPWTGESEFFAGLDLAAPEGSAVITPAAGRVVFTGRAPRSVQPRLWQFGNLVVIAHGPAFATVFGHLSSIAVRRGAAVARGQRLGGVGSTGWALSPRLHYELWRRDGGAWTPTDPLFSILDRRLDSRHLSLEQMRATSAPGPPEPLPGVS